MKTLKIDNTNVKSYSFALVGNPNVGKSTLYNALTGDVQHTGNWSGKTIELCKKQIEYADRIIHLTDLPGTYSLYQNTPEEIIARNEILSNNYDCLIIVANSVLLERNLTLIMQTLAVCSKAVLCLNMADEMVKKGLILDTDELSLQLGIPVVKVSALNKSGINELINTAQKIADCKINTFVPHDIKRISDYKDNSKEKNKIILDNCNRISNLVIKENIPYYSERDKKIDKIFTSKFTGIPIMLIIFALIFWLTAFVANYPSQWLSSLFTYFRTKLIDILSIINVPSILISILCDGIYTTVSWVVSVMLPPALIFFSLFSILEESGYLPRIAFNLDKLFSKAGINGKLSISMLMGLGCNSCGVMGCRIVKSKKERIICAITNSFIPCNGRFPTLIAIISIFLSNSYNGLKKSIVIAMLMVLFMLLSFTLTLLTSFFFSKTIFKNDTSSFILELPSYKRPKLLKILPKVLKEKVFFVLTRAIAVSAPSGVVIWIVTNININNTPIISYISNFFDPFGLFIGLDGVIIVSYLLGFPANEIVLPIMLMLYKGNTTLTEYTSISQLGEILYSNGWTVITAICMCLLCLFHFPCATTCATIKKETKSTLWTVVSIVTPLMIGIMLCLIVSGLWRFTT